MEKMIVEEDIFCSPRREVEEDIFCSPEREVEEDDDDDDDDDDERNEMTCDDEEEKRKLDLMRAILEKQDPPCKETDDLTLRRFLRARNLNVEKAAEMFMKYIIWRRTFVPNGSISASEVTNELAQNKVFMQGKDKNGCPIGVLLGARHFPRKEGLEELKRSVVFIQDKLCSRIPDGQEKYTFIADLKGYGYCNTDVRASLAGFSILQDYYPERLGKLFIIHVPYIFMTLWKIIYPFIDKNTKEKIVFVENKRLQDTLREYIDESQFPDIYGGKLKLVPIQEA